ncbi:hypothetical protein Sjap_006444 [Stephania japonica]|uniref:Uncharacterized protein n=1 Tax=Stephania japonica TaxID=461633 RepID=A0AAP0K600_9MAGN
MELKFGRTRLFLGLKFGAALTCSHVRYLQSLRPSSAPIRFLNFAVALYIICPIRSLAMISQSRGCSLSALEQLHSI